jgi:hypothetical protein
MAKAKGSTATTKNTFNKKKSQPTGKSAYGPKDQKPKPYRGQGR